MTRAWKTKMPNRRITASGWLMLIGQAVLILWLFRVYIINFVTAAVALSVCYRILMARAGVKSKNGHTVLGAVAGFIIGRSHTKPCAQCGKPLDTKSRAAYCSTTCREYARSYREDLRWRQARLDEQGEVQF